jgi:hypothetical protein
MGIRKLLSWDNNPQYIIRINSRIKMLYNILIKWKITKNLKVYEARNSTALLLKKRESKLI